MQTTTKTQPQRPKTVKVKGGWRGYVINRHTGRLVEVFIPEKGAEG